MGAKQFLARDGAVDYANIDVGAAGVKPLYRFTYSFAVNGGAQASIALTQLDGPLPIRFIITCAILDVTTPLGSAGAAECALTTGQGAGDLVANTVIAGAPWAAAGLKNTIVVPQTATTFIKATASRSPALVNSVANLNAGIFALFIEGYQALV